MIDNKLKILLILHHPLEQVPLGLVHHSCSCQDQAILLSCHMLHQLHHQLWSQVVCSGQGHEQELVDCVLLRNRSSWNQWYACSHSNSLSWTPKAKLKPMVSWCDTHTQVRKKHSIQLQCKFGFHVCQLHSCLQTPLSVYSLNFNMIDWSALTTSTWVR